MRILVVPETLRAQAVQLRQAALRVEELHQQVQRAYANLDWEVRGQMQVETFFIQVRRQALALQEEAERLARFLLECADAFERADAESSTALAHTVAAFPILRATAETTLPLATIFPTGRAESYTRLGALLSGTLPTPLIRLTRIPIEAEERRALLDFSTDWLLSRIEPLGTLKDLFDMTQIPRWNEQVNQAVAAWEQARRQFGAQSPQAQAAYGHYVETKLFKMPFFGTLAQAGISILKILGRASPVQ